jgi:preprotein translocase subunit SecG
MGFLIGLVTVVMVLTCLILIFLVLIQLPKKDAGAGLAFGASATDALFGAGSGTVLTKITKYAAGVFFALAVLLSVMQSYYHSRSTSRFQQRLGQAGQQPAGALAPPSSPSAVPATTSTSPPAITPAVPAITNQLLSTPAEAGNPPPATTNPPPPK